MIRRRQDSGVSMIELIIAVAVMVLALIALMSSVISSTKVADTAKESVIAYEAARAKIEEIRTYTKCTSFSNIFTYYKNGTSANTSTVAGLNAGKVGGNIQPVLQIVFPVDTSGHLSETLPTAVTPVNLNYNSSRMGMPKDLNRDGDSADTGDGTGSATDLDITYKVIPVMIRVIWESVGKTAAQIEVVTYITEK